MNVFLSEGVTWGRCTSGLTISAGRPSAEWASQTRQHERASAPRLQLQRSPHLVAWQDVGPELPMVIYAPESSPSWASQLDKQ